MKPLTINELYKECEKQIKKGNGNKVIMLSDDDEGNGYHYCWYSFTNIEDALDTYIQDDYLINERIAKKEDTIILG